MGILEAAGTALFLLILLVLMPQVFAEFEKTLIVFLQSSQEALTAAGTLAGAVAHTVPRY